MISETMRCPTCRAEQVWSDTCRRCKSDLQLLRDLAEEYAFRKGECLRLLQQNSPEAALEQARLCYKLHKDTDSCRLLAVCEFLNGRFAEAVRLANSLLHSSTASTPV
jgi:hypothetical protein